MNVLILAAGYGTRLAKGIEADQTGNFNHLKGLPKALLPIGDGFITAECSNGYRIISLLNQS